MALRTSVSSGPTSRRRSVSVLDGAIWSKRHEFAGGGQAVFGDAVVAQLQHFLAADPGQPQDFDGGERPERILVLIG
jgi:hypothetical protein